MAKWQSDFVSAVLEEIALEGLEGITIEALWTRLNVRPNFLLRPLSEDIQSFLWTVVTSLSKVEFFSLPSPRKPLVIFNRSQHVDASGHFIEPDDISIYNIYEHKPVNKNGDMGSCSTYDERINISSIVRTKQLHDVLACWGNCLVIVAHQEIRRLILTNPDYNPLTELTIMQYCVLERIGRSRYHGELTQGKLGLQLISEDPKLLFYYRKHLFKQKLITKQIFYLRIGKSNATGSLLHLPRFSSVVKQKHATDGEKLMDYIQVQPGQYILYKNVYDILGNTSDVRKVLQKYKRLKTEMVPYRKIYPDCKSSDWKTKCGEGEKLLRIIRLSQHPGSDEDEEFEDDEEEQTGLLGCGERRLDRIIVRQCYEFIEMAGPRGLSQVAIGQLAGLPSLQARSVCKYMVKNKMCGIAFVDMGRQRVSQFYSKKYDSSKFALVNEMKEEKSKLLQMVSSNHNKINQIEDSSSKNVLAEKSLSDPPLKKLKVDENSENFFKNIIKENVIKPSQEEIDAIETEIIDSHCDTPYEKSFPNLSSVTATEVSSSSLTLTILRRANLILQAINTHKVIHDPQKLQRMINEEEESEGATHVIDRRTVQRLIEKLESDGYLKTIKVSIKGYGKERNMTFICHPSVDKDNSEIQSAIEQAKMKLPIITRDTVKKNLRYNSSIESLIPNQASPPKLTQPLFKPDQKASKRYGFKPKFVRMQVLHVYMYYLVYGYKGDLNLNQEESKKQILSSLNLEESLVDEMSTVYSTTVNWMMFIPPLPAHEDYEEGWSLMSDLLLRLPLSIFLNIINVPYNIPNLMDYLDHPIKKYYLVKHLPSDIANHLTYNRKYIFAVSEIVTRLAYIGLVQMGPQKLKEKDQVFIYLNRHTILLDTTTSGPGYNHVSKNIEYEQLNYHFTNKEAIEQYWQDLWSCAMNTNLGCRNTMTGQPVVIESINTKKILMPCLYPKTFEDARTADIGYLPGDHLGAGGIDSDLFVEKLLISLRISPKPIKTLMISAKINTRTHALRREDELWAANIESKNIALFFQYFPIPRTVHLKRSWYWPSDDKNDENSLDKGIIQKPRVKEVPNRSYGKKRKITQGNNNSEESKTKKVNSGNIEIKEEFPNQHKFKKGNIMLKPRRDVRKRNPKHKKITRILKPKKMRFGRKPYYDQKDKEALKRMVKLRVDWSSTEDNILLICKVASLYMSPNTKRQVAKNFCAVREILHNAYPNLSRNKTSRACQRRMHYMMKNPSTAHSVYMCLEEIKQDPEINDKFSQAVEKLDAMLKAQGEGPKGYQKEYDKIFNSLVATLLSKLKTITSAENATLDNVSIPDSIDEFREKYSVVFPKNVSLQNSFNEVQNSVDILCSVVNTILHSSLCCAADKTSYSYQLFHVYQQYPDKLLRSVLAKCRAMSIISCRKRYKRWKSSGGCLPLSSSPYQLSITYVNILQTRYQYYIFSECYRGLKYILEELEKERNTTNAVCVKNRKNEKLLQNSDSTGRQGSIVLNINNGGECANVVELYSAGCLKMNIEFPEQLIVLDPRLTKAEESYKLIVKRFRELISMIKGSSAKSDQKSLLSEEEDDEEEDDDLNVSKTKKITEEESSNTIEEELSLSNKTGIANPATRLALYLMRDEPFEHIDQSLQHAHDLFVLKPCKISVQLDKNKAENHLLSEELRNDTITEIKRFCIFPESHTDTDSIVECIGSKINKRLLVKLMKYLEEKKELGATYADIEEHVGRSQDMENILCTLVHKQFILKSGCINVRFVHNKYSKPWLIRSYFIPRYKREELGNTNTNTSCALSLANNENKALSFEDGTSLDKHIPTPEKINQSDVNCDLNERMCNIGKKDVNRHIDDENLRHDFTQADCDTNRAVVRPKRRKWVTLSKENLNKFGEINVSSLQTVHVSIRPWIRVDGTLNRRVLDRLLGSVLGHCLGVPGITMKQLQNRFSPALQPVHTLELVDILQKIGCVHTMVVKRSVKPNLFTKKEAITIGAASGFDSVNDVVIEPELVAVSKLGQFIGNKAYGKDYLDALTDFKLLSYS